MRTKAHDPINHLNFFDPSDPLVKLIAAHFAVPGEETRVSAAQTKVSEPRTKVFVAPMKGFDLRTEVSKLRTKVFNLPTKVSAAQTEGFSLQTEVCAALTKGFTAQTNVNAAFTTVSEEIMPAPPHSSYTAHNPRLVALDLDQRWSEDRKGFVYRQILA